MDRYDKLMNKYEELVADNMDTIQELDNERRRVEHLQETIDKIIDLCIDVSNDDKAMSGEHLLADDILEIINEY